MDDLRRLLARERRAGRHRADDRPAGRAQLGLREAVERVAPGRPRSKVGAVWIGRVVQVEGADRDHERVVRGRVGHRRRLPALALVAGGSHDDDTREPELLDRLVERVPAEAGRGRGVEREVRDPDVVLTMVLEDPLGRRDHVARARHALVVHHVQRDDPGSRVRARMVRRRAGGEARNECPVAAAVAGRVALERSHVELGEHPAAEVGPARVDARVDEGDRRRRVRALGLRGLLGCQARPELVGADRGGPVLAGAVRRRRVVRIALRLLGLRIRLGVEHDRLVGRDHETGRLCELRQVAGDDLAGGCVDDVEAGALRPEVVESALSVGGAVHALDDDGHGGVRRLRGRELERRRQVAVTPGTPVALRVGGGRQRCRQCEHQQREQAAPHRLVTSFARTSAAAPRSPEAAAAGLASQTILVPQVSLPFLRLRAGRSSSGHDRIRGRGALNHP